MDAAGLITINENCWLGYGEVLAKMDFCGIRLYQEGKMIYEDYSHAQHGFRMLAGALGLPFIPCRSPLGSDILNPEFDALGKAGARDGKNPKIPRKKLEVMEDPFFNSGKVILVPAARPEVGVIHAQQVGDMGTVRCRGCLSLDKELAFACDKLIVTCEEIVPEEVLRSDPNSNTVPFVKVDAVVQIPWGAHPTSVPYYYDYDAKFIRESDKAQRSADTMKVWLDEWVYGPKDWSEYLNKVGGARLAEIRADSIGYSTRQVRGNNPPPRAYKPLSWRKEV
jgi:glutaconate CoA-transferase subunit A